MNYIAIQKSDFSVFQDLARDYYRDGEDADTPQEQIDSFIQYVFDLVGGCLIMGYLVFEKNFPIGFILFGVDNEILDFSQIPGAGTNHGDRPDRRISQAGTRQAGRFFCRRDTV